MSIESPSPPAKEQTAQDQPLALTVHALPKVDPSAPVNTHGRLKMLIILLVCAAPVMASYFMYYVVRPDGRRNYGELITPQRTLPSFNVTAADGSKLNFSTLKDQWLLISVAGGACDAVCRQNLYFQRQLRESLGREKDRVDWVWLVSDDEPIPEPLQPALNGATVLRVSPPDLAQWLDAAPGQRLADHLYLVDPMGNWMMRFPAVMDAAGAAKAKSDLERLLRAASSWDNEGRPAAVQASIKVAKP
jgi:hypothetical protein